MKMVQMKLLDMKTPAHDFLLMTGQDTLLCGVPLARAAGLVTALRITRSTRSCTAIISSRLDLVGEYGRRDARQ